MTKKLITFILAATLLFSGCIKQPTSTSPVEPGIIPPTGTPNPVPSSPASPTPAPRTQPAPSTTPQVDLLKVVGQIGGPIRSMAVAGNYAYVGVGLRLIIFDVSSPSAIREVGATEPFGYYVEDVTIVGSTAFVAAGSSGIYIVDISNRDRPGIIGSYDTPGYAERVAVNGGYAYVADGPAGLLMIDIKEPTRPTEAEVIYGLNYAFDVAIENGRAYIAGAGAGLLVADVSDPTKPRELGTLDTPGYAYRLAFSGSVAYIADGWGGLRIVDVADPSRPQEISFIDTPGWVFDVVANEDEVYLADGSGGGWVVNVSNPKSPVILGDLWESKKLAGEHITRLALSGQFVYAVDRTTGMQVINISNPAKPVHVGAYKPAGFAGHVAVAGTYAYIGGTFPGSSDLRVLDVSDPTHIQEISVRETGVNGRIVEVQGEFLYAFGFRNEGAMLQVFSLSNPAQPKTIALQLLEGPPVSMFLKNGIAYVTTEFGFEIIDISNPASPSKLGVLDFTEGRGRAAGAETTMGVAVSGSFAYITHTKYGFMVVDVSDPTKPTVVTSTKPAEVWKALSLIVDKDLAYIASHGALEVVDISDPKNPVWVTKHKLAAYGQHLTVTDGIAYVAEGPGGLEVFDVTDPRKPILIGSHTLTGRASSVDVDSKYIYVATGEGGLYVLERPSGTTGVRRTSAVLTDRSTEPIQSKAIFIATTTLKVFEHTSADTLVPESSLGSVKGIDGASHPSAPSVLPGSGQTWTVNSASDSGPGTLRSALESARSGDIIIFNPSVFLPTKPLTISPTSPLPYVSQGSVTIDGSNAGIILDGSKLPPGTNGLIITSDYNVVKGLQIVNFPGAGIGIAGGSFNIVGGDRSRETGPSGEGNVISGNRDAGIGISDSVERVASDIGTKPSSIGTSTGNKIVGNYIGIDSSGTTVVGAQGAGVFIGGKNSSRNIIGGINPADRNVISGNMRGGVSLIGRPYDNTILGNYIGTDYTGIKALGNGWAGVSIEGAFNNVVKANVISGNRQSGVIISDAGASGNGVVGNLIGTDATGTSPLGNNSAGVEVNESFNRIGGTAPEERNVVSGNKGRGIRVGWQSTTGVVVIGNYVGIDVTGTKALGNGEDGIWLTEGTYRNFIGGTTNAEGNVIGGNSAEGRYGIRLEGAGIRDNFVAGNSVGTASDRTTALPNRSGIGIQGSDYNFVQSNLVAYNKDFGITIKSGVSNRVHHNSIVNNNKNGYDQGKNNWWDDGRQGNFWSDYKGQDQNGDGIGDTPYQIPPSGIDDFPLIKSIQGPLR